MRVLAGFLLLLLLAGCDLYGKVGIDDTNIEGALPELLVGEWVYIPPGSALPSEKYIMEEDTIQYGYGGGESPYDFKGSIRFVSNYSKNSGLIIIEYTESPYYQGHNANSFSAVYYRNLSNNTVQLANVIDLADGYSSADTTTLEEAVEKFTRLKMGNHVDWSVVQPQRRVR